MVPATKQEIFQGKTFLVAKSKLAGQVHVLRNYQPFDFILFIWMFRFWWGNDCLGEIFSSSPGYVCLKSRGNKCDIYQIHIDGPVSPWILIFPLSASNHSYSIELKIGFYRNIHQLKGFSFRPKIYIIKAKYELDKRSF